jgi:hypothetical protein
MSIPIGTHVRFNGPGRGRRCASRAASRGPGLTHGAGACAA